MLMPIMGLTELTVRALPDESREKDNLQKVLMASRRAADVVKRVLSFARQDQSQDELLDIAAAVEEAISLLHAALPATIRIESEINRAAGTVKSTTTHVHQIVMNLARNATKAMDDKPGTLRIHLSPVTVGAARAARHPDLKPGRYVRLVIKDTGRGMDSDTVARIFDPFFTTGTVGQGTGLGLSVVHGLVTSAGGTIHVASKVGKGTTFKIYFPLIEAKASEV